MNHELDEVDATPRRVGLYNVTYLHNNEEHVTALLLKIGKHNKNLIKKTISKLVNIPYRSISGIKLKFRKQVLNYNSGYEGTRKYFDDLGLQKESRKRKGIQKRLYTCHRKKYPYRCRSRMTDFSRHQFTTIDELHAAVKANHHKQTFRYYLNIELGYYLVNTETSKRHFFYASENTAFYDLGENPMINTSVDLVLRDIPNLETIIENIKRESTKWMFERLYEYVILTTPLPDKPIGSNILLPKEIKDKKCIIGFDNVENNLCFWYCLAYLFYEGRIDRLKNKVNELFKQFYGEKPKDSYQGVSMMDLESLEHHFNINVNVYRYEEQRGIMIRQSANDYKTILNLNLYEDTITEEKHFSFIKDIKSYCQVFQCADCRAFLTEYKKLKQHAKICQRPRIIFQPGNYEPPKNVFEELDELGILVPNNLRFYPYFIFFDVETWLKETTQSSQGKLHYSGSHELLSISLMGNKESEPIFIPVETTAENALELMITEMNQIRMKYISELYKTYEPFFQQISKLQDEKIMKQVRRKLFEWIDAIPVYGFNSSGYDINVFRKFLPKVLSKFQKNHGNISKAEKEWILSLNEKLNRTLMENYRIGKYNVDGYDSETKTVYEFYGCFFHGCPKCYTKDAFNPLARKLMHQLYNYTIKRENDLKCMGYSVVSIWECQFECKAGIQINNVIKSNNRYKMISNGKFIFKDILAYLSQGTSLDEFLKSFDTEKTKASFPHKVTQNISKYLKENPTLTQHKGNVIELLQNSKIPHKDWFSNDMTNQKIQITDYLKIQNNYQNLYELLKDYNNSDVQPAVEAIGKLSAMFTSLNLDIHKDAISIPGLSLKSLWSSKEPGIEFKLFQDNEKLYDIYRNNLVGGPSIVFHHYHEKNKTLIRNQKVCKKVFGFDANALYLWAIGQDMLCGEHEVIDAYPGLVNDILSGLFYGVVECDVQVPEGLKDYFAEMAPIFKHSDISYENVSEDTKTQVKENYKSQKLIGSLHGQKMAFHTELLKWYLQKGIVVSNITLVVRYQKAQPFQNFMQQVTEARRKGDVAPEYKLKGEMMKLLGNASYGKCITNFTKHESVKIVTESQYPKYIAKNTYKSHEDLVDGYEFRLKKTSFKQNLPIQIGFAVYQLAKLKMLQFYYDFIDFYFDRADYQYCQMDTDSAYIAFSSENLNEIVKPELQEHFQQNKHSWLCRTDTEEEMLFDKRTPGLFKEEFQGDGIIALSSKMYHCIGGKKKLSCKGINQRQNKLVEAHYRNALLGNSSQEFTNKGFRIMNGVMSSYSLIKAGMKLFNDKRLRNGFSTLPLSI